MKQLSDIICQFEYVFDDLLRVVLFYSSLFQYLFCPRPTTDKAQKQQKDHSAIQANQ